MSALAVDTQSIERRGDGSSEIAIGAPTGLEILERVANLGGENPSVVKELSDALVLLVGRSVHAAGHGDRNALLVWHQVEHPRHHLVSLSWRGDPHVDFGDGLFRHDVGARSTADDADIGSDTPRIVGEAFYGEYLACQLAHRTAAILMARAGVCRLTFDAQLEACSTLARRDDLTPFPCRLRHEHISGVAR